MKLSEGVEWTLHCATVLGTLQPGQALSGARLAEYHDVPVAYLAKQLQAMSRAGIVESVPGRGGGYRLAKPPEQITMLDVVLAIDGPEPAFRCTEIRQQGPAALPAARYPRPCGIARRMWAAEEAWRSQLEKTTIAELIAEVTETADPEHLEKIILWMVDALS